MEKAEATERLVRKFARGYERGGSTRYIAASEMALFIEDLIREFSGLSFAVRKDRGNGATLSVRSRATREELYFARVHNTDSRGRARSPVSFSLMFENMDINF